jgi:hypothetical protein
MLSVSVIGAVGEIVKLGMIFITKAARRILHELRLQFQTKKLNPFFSVEVF